MSSAVRDAVVVDVVRTTLGKRGGALSGWHPADLLGFALGSLVERTGVDPGRIDDVIGGCVTQVGEQSTNVTRNGWVSAGLPQHVPATTVDRQCGSSQQAMHFAAAGVNAGHYDLVVACGVESMSRVKLAANARGGTGPFPPSFLDHIDGRLWAQFRVAQVLADRWGITREEMDAFALESHRRAAAAWDEGQFAGEAVPVPLKAEDGTPTGALLEADEGIRRGTTVEKLASLKPAFVDDGVIHAGNSSQISDGAAALLVTTSEMAVELGLTPIVRYRAGAVTGADPVLMLTGPIPATEKVLAKAGVALSDVGAFEVNEAFAPVPLAWIAETGADPRRVNPLGGAIALGHPLGASGAVLMTRLVHHMRDNGIRYGLQTMCEGGGTANATVVELLN